MSGLPGTSDWCLRFNAEILGVAETFRSHSAICFRLANSFHDLLIDER
jgi:hypothetical protein